MMNQEKIMELLAFSSIMPYVTPKLQSKILGKIISLLETDFHFAKEEIELLNDFYQMVEIDKKKMVEKFKKKHRKEWTNELSS